MSHSRGKQAIVTNDDAHVKNEDAAEPSVGIRGNGDPHRQIPRRYAFSRSRVYARRRWLTGIDSPVSRMMRSPVNTLK